MNSNEFLSRRSFFKSAAKKTLPVLAAIALPSIFSSCEGDYSDPGTESGGSSGIGGCQGSCSNICMSTCEKNSAYQPVICSGSSYKAACMSTCKATCKGTCSAGSR